MYKIFMLVMVPVLAIGWFLYWRWNKKIEEEEKNQPKPVSKQLQKSRNELTNWAEKMKTSDSPAEQARKRKLELDKKLEDQEKKWAEEQKKREQDKKQT